MFKKEEKEKKGKFETNAQKEKNKNKNSKQEKNCAQSGGLETETEETHQRIIIKKCM